MNNTVANVLLIVS